MDLPMRRGTSPGDHITVDASRRFQSIDGFGFAMTDTSAYLIDRLARGARDRLLHELFDATEGIGVSWVRLVIGATDFTPAPPPWYSYRPSPGEAFDIGRPRTGSPHGDYSHIIPLLRSARELTHGAVRFFANPHSAPAWMKKSNDLSNFGPDGCLLGYCEGAGRAPDFRDEYAEYLIDFVKAYQASGVPIYALGVQNEPNGKTNYPGGDFAGPDEADFIARLKKKMAAQDPPLPPQVWGEFLPAQAPSIVAGAADPSAIDGLSYHCYYLYPLKLIADFLAAELGKTAHLTECTQSRAGPLAKAARTIDVLITHSRLGASSIASWNLALEPRGGPHSILCLPGDRCDKGSIMTAPVIISGPPGKATAAFTRQYYEMGHFSKFVRPGAVRIASTNVKGLSNVAFRNEDGSFVLVVHNTRRSSVTFGVNVPGHRHFDVTNIPPDGIATFTWR